MELLGLFRRNDKKLGIALGGGAAWAVAHIGVLEVLEENGIKIDGIAGTSAGSIVAALYAFGYKPYQIKEMALNLKLGDVFHWKMSKMGLSQTDRIEKLIISAIGEKKIGDANMPLFITATDLMKAEQFVFLDDTPVHVAVAASCAIPGIFVPLELNDMVLVDGSLVADVNCKVLKENGFDVVIGVELSTYWESRKPSNVFEVIFESLKSMVEGSNKELSKYADLIVKPNIGDIGRFEIEKTPLLLQKGREAMTSGILKLKDIL